MNKIELKDLCFQDEIGKYGIPASAEVFSEEKVRYLRISDIDDNGNLLNNDMKSVSSDEIDKYILKEGDIVFARTGNSTGRSYYHENKNGQLAFAGFLIKYGLDPNKVNPKYIKYFTISNEYKQWVKNLSVGSTRGNINAQTFASCPIVLPKRSQQDILVNILSALDDKIELNNKINAELEAMAKTMYDYWFVQFDFPNAEGKPYKSSGGKMVFNETLKREIPEGWEVSVFNDWIKQTKTGDWGKEEIEGNYTERVFCVRGADINGLNGRGEVKAPERYILKNNLSKKLEDNDFIIEISGGSPTQSTARIALLTKETLERFDTNVVCSNFCKAVTLKETVYAFNFQQEWQRLYDAGVFFGFEGKTSGIKNFLFDSFMDSYHIVKPPKELAQKYNSFAKELEKKKQSNLKQNQELAQLRDWLLPMLMNGQVKVEDTYSSSEPQTNIAAEAATAYQN